MKTRLIISVLLLFLTTRSLQAQRQNVPQHPRLPINNQDSITIGIPSANIPTADELQPAQPGMISKLDLKWLTQINSKISSLLTSAPDADNGKRSAWFAKLQTWKSLFDNLLSTGTQVDALKLIPGMAEFLNRDKSSEDPSQFLGQVDMQMRDCGSYLLKAAASYVTQQNGVVDTLTLSNFVQLFAIRGFVSESDWEDNPMPIDAGGIMILNATAVVTQLKAGAWLQAQKYIGGDGTTSVNFFARYSSSGDGLAVIKTKYVQNVSEILGKFSELKSWILQQEQAK